MNIRAKPDDTALPEGIYIPMLGERAQQTLRWVLILLFTTGVAATLNGVVLNAFRFETSSLGGMATVAVTAYSFWLAHHNRLRAAVLVLTWGSTLIVLSLTFVVAGVRTPALMVLPGLCVAAAWLASTRAGVTIFIVSACVIVGMVVAERFGYVPPNVPRNSIAYALLLVPSILFALLISIGAIQGYRAQIARITELTGDQHQQLAALRDSEERFAVLFRANPVPSSTNDENGILIDVNDAWVALYGIAREKALGKTAFELGLWTEDAPRQQVYDRLKQGEKISGMAFNFVTAGGVIKPFLLYISPVEYGGGRRYVTSQLDQSDRFAAEAAQRAVTEELETRVQARTAELQRTVADLTTAQHELVRSEKLASLGSMVAGISHELNTPIGNTVTVASTLQSQAKDFSKLVESGTLRRADLTDFLAMLQDMADIISRSTTRASELIASFKQVAVDRSSERRREFDLQGLVHDIVTSLKPTLRGTQVEFDLQVPGGLLCDSFPGPVGQVLTNLVQNAVTHAFAETGKGRIAISAKDDGGKVVLRVADDGVGMTEHTLNHAFDPFFTTRLGKGGSGLGLSVSYSIATSILRGDLSATSTPGQGSVFTLTFLRALPKDA